MDKLKQIHEEVLTVAIPTGSVLSLRTTPWTVSAPRRRGLAIKEAFSGPLSRNLFLKPPVRNPPHRCRNLLGRRRKGHGGNRAFRPISPQSPPWFPPRGLSHDESHVLVRNQIANVERKASGAPTMTEGMTRASSV